MSKGKPKVLPKKRSTGPEAKRSAGVGGRTRHRPRRAGKGEEMVKLVKAGVEGFILDNATMEDFWRTLHSAGEPESLYSHQLTGSVLTKIVKQAIQKRARKLRRAGPS